jgi:tetratricopeptide (TPR) repeat protein
MYITIKRNIDWRNLYTLLFHDMRVLQNSSQANMITGYNCSSMSAALESQDTMASREWAAKAIDYYKTSLRISPEMTVNYYLLGNIYRYGLKNFEEAERNYLYAYARMPGIPGLSRQMASLYFTSGEYAKAIPFYAKAASEEPDNADLLFHQATNMYSANDIAEYLKLSDELLKKFPSSYYPYLNYATYYFSIHDMLQMSTNLEKAVQLGCKDPMVFRTLVKYFSGIKDYQKALYYKNMMPK